jgi:hypothetical protein
MVRLIASALLLVAAPAAAQTPAADRAAVMATVDAALAAVSAQDDAALAALLAPDALFYRESTMADGSLKAGTITSAAMLEGLRGPKRGFSELRTGQPTVHIRKGIAQVWTEYSFDIAGKRSHCGIDTISLIRIDGAWRIASFGWTKEPEGCPK